VPVPDASAADASAADASAADASPPDASPPDASPPDASAPDASPPESGLPVITRQVTIANKRGLHARAAAKFATMAERFNASVDVHRDGQTVSARSIMGLMMLGAGKGASIELQAQGWDAREALDALAALVEAGFDESG
jgi:phosphocarrier protein